MLVHDKRCKACKLIKQDPKALKEIFNSRHYTKYGEPLTNLAPRLGLPYQSLYNHVHHHQFLSEEDMLNKRMNEMDKKLVSDKLKTVVKHTDLRQEIIDEVMKKLQAGELKPSVRDGLTAAGQQLQIEENQKDRGVKMMEMIAHFQSGELERPASGTIIDSNPDSLTDGTDGESAEENNV